MSLTYFLLLMVVALAGCQGGSSSDSLPGEPTGQGDSAPPSAGSPPPADPPAADPDPAPLPPEPEPDPGSDPEAEPPGDEQEPPPEADDPATTADIYTQLRGYGTQSTFGMGGDICTVTSLADDGAGTLRKCLADRRGGDIPLEIQFDVGGTITLASNLRIDSPYLTINGATAPDPGITIQTDSLKGVLVLAQTSLDKAHDVLISHLRIRGIWDRTSNQDVEHNTTLALDCENNDSGSDDVDLNVVLNHLTLMNSPDGGPDIWGACRGITVQRSFMHHNVHPTTISAGSDSQLRARISLHHNIYWDNQERNPQIRGNVSDLDMINNVIGGWTWYGVRLRGNSASVYPRRINLIGNALLGDGGSSDQLALEFLNHPSRSSVYDQDNRVPDIENDRGTATAMFGDGQGVVQYQTSQLAEVLAGTGSGSRVGMHFPTSEELALLAQVRERLGN